LSASVSFGNLVDNYLDAAAKKLGDELMALFGYPVAREKQCRACGASGARYPRALVELNRENSCTPLSHVLAIADDVLAKFEMEFDPYVLG
jgi:class 3 adenylate cyclase